MNLSTKQKQIHRHREQTCHCVGGGGVEGRTESLELADTNYIEWINSEVLLYSTGNYIQHPVINHNGKEYEKNVDGGLMDKLCPTLVTPETVASQASLSTGFLRQGY